MRKVFTVFAILIFLNCCCRDEIVGTYRLTDLQSSLIPYDEIDELTYINQDGELFTTTTVLGVPTTNTYRRGAESCELIDTEELTASLQFQSNDISSIELRLYADVFTSFQMEIQSSSDETSQYLALGCTDIDEIIIEESFQDIRVHQTNYENVMVFIACLEDSQIKRVIFSQENGIEFIEFSDKSKWIKLNV